MKVCECINLFTNGYFYAIYQQINALFLHAVYLHN